MTDIKEFHNSNYLVLTRNENKHKNATSDGVLRCREHVTRSSNSTESHVRASKSFYRFDRFSPERILAMIAIFMFIQCQISHVDCGGSSALPRVDINDAHKSSDEDHIGDSVGSPIANSGLYLDKIGSLGSLEMSIAAVFNKVAYGTTTKRSIPDNVFIPNLTTMPTPQLTTYR